MNKDKNSKELSKLNVVGPQTSQFRPGRGGFGGAKLKKGSFRTIVPAKDAELVSVARAMHGDSFGARLQETMNDETNAAVNAIRSGMYIGWRCPDFNWDCIRVGDESLCFCGHKLINHRLYSGVKEQVSCAAADCRCRSYAFIPSHPRHVGEFWLQKRPNYDPTTWKAKCRCKHTHDLHSTTGVRKCTIKACRCNQFESNFLCASCDRHWEDHQTYFETEQARIKSGMPTGEDYLPFAELPSLRNIVMSTQSDEVNQQLSIESRQAFQGSTSKQADNNTPVPFGYKKPKGSPFGAK